MSYRVGVIGGGQLAWMMASGAKALDIQLVVQTPTAQDPAVAIAPDPVLAAVADASATATLAKRCDVITFENEFVDLEGLQQLAQAGIRFYPQLETLAPLLDKFHQRQHCAQMGISSPQFAALATPPDAASLTQFSFPVVLKARRHGYDGQGTFILGSQADLEAALGQADAQASWLLEEFVPFERELAVMVARSTAGEVVVYPVVETQQEDQVCRRVLVPADLDHAVVKQVEAIARQFVEGLQAVGIFGLELFYTQDGRVLLNEVAPRTHNSGHYSLDACVTSQFEQQLRAICGLPLGDASLTCDAAVMVNLLGFETSGDDYAALRQQIGQIPQAHVYWYGKTSRPGRKLGHVTVRLDGVDPPAGRTQGLEIAQQIEALWYPA